MYIVTMHVPFEANDASVELFDSVWTTFEAAQAYVQAKREKYWANEREVTAAAQWFEIEADCVDWNITQVETNGGAEHYRQELEKP